MSKTIRILVGLSLGALTLTVVSVLVASALFVQRGAVAANESATVAVGSNGADGKQVSSTELTSAEVAAHNTPTNCWMIVANNVYNFTSFLNAHPGGSITMTPYCGKEATAAFNTKDKKPETKHTSSAISMLAQYYVGALGSRITTLANGTPKANVTPLPKQSSLSLLMSTIGNTASALLGNAPAVTTTSVALTSATVASHNTSANCWIIVSGSAYDVTGYLVQHPGGVGTITPYCGREATNAFNTKDKGSAHSSFASQLLASYRIGTIGSTVTSTTVNGGGGIASAPTVTPTPTLLPGQSPSPTPTQMPVAQSGYTVAQVATHALSSNCWIIVSSKAYNVSSYLVDHPGGVGVITPYCGKEATNAFATKGYGSNHSNSAYALLNNYFVGNIVTGGAASTPTPTPTLPPGQSPTPTSTPIPAAPTPTPLPQNTGGYTAADVASHNTASNCWIIISSKVYSLASYLTKHPGGVNVITKYCGKESTNAFQTKDGKGSNHSNSAYNQLAPYFIGNLVAATQPTPTPIPGATSTPTPTTAPGGATSTPTPTTGGGTNNNCTKGVLPDSVTAKYPGATIRSQSVEDNCSQEMKINTSSGSCRDIKTNSSGSITEDKSC